MVQQICWPRAWQYFYIGKNSFENNPVHIIQGQKCGYQIARVYLQYFVYFVYLVYLVYLSTKLNI